MRLTCPFCGERSTDEFVYLGSAEPIDAWQADAIVQHPMEILAFLGNH